MDTHTITALAVRGWTGIMLIATRLALLAAIAACFVASRGQAEQIMGERWVRFLGAEGLFYSAADVAVDGAGNVFASSSRYGGTPAQNGSRIGKFAAADGALLWEHFFPETENRKHLGLLKVDSNGDLIASGIVEISGQHYNFYTAKYRGSDGQRLWEQTYSGAFGSTDQPHALALDQSGNVIVTGFTSVPGYEYDYYTAKYAAADGALLWEKTYNGTAGDDDRAHFVDVDPQGNVIVSGSSETPLIAGGRWPRVHTIKYAAADGAVMWQQRLYEGETPDTIVGFDVNAAGDVILTGSIGTNTRLVKLAGSNGQIVWNKPLSSTTELSYQFRALDSDAAGDVFTTGMRRVYRPATDDHEQRMYTAKFSGATGDLVWEQVNAAEADSGSDTGIVITVNSEGNPVIMGLDYGASGYHVYTASYASADGGLLWGLHTAFGVNESANAMAVAPDGTVAVTGDVTHASAHPQTFIVKYGLVTPPPPQEVRLWVAGEDLVKNEKPDAGKELAGAKNATVPEWSYGYRADVNGTDFTAMPAGAHTNQYGVHDAVEGWSSDQALILVNTGTQPAQYFSGTVPLRLLQPKQMYLGLPSSFFVPVVRWTAPASGDYRILAKWFDMDDTNDTANGAAAHVLINGVQVFGRRQNNAFVGQTWKDGGNAVMPASTFRLNAGDLVDFVLSGDGDIRADATTFTAAITPVAAVTIATPSSPATFVQGDNVPVTVAVDHKYPVTAVKLRINGQDAAAPADTTPPYEFVLSNLEPASYYLTAVAQDDSGAVAASPQVKLVIARTDAAAMQGASAERKGSVNTSAAATAGRTLQCTQSGSWDDPATWGGQGVPGAYDDVFIPVGFEVSVPSGQREVHNLDTAGRLVGIDRPTLTIYGSVQATNYMRGLSIFTVQSSRFSNVAGALVLDDVLFVSWGDTFIGERGSIYALGDSELHTKGKLTMLNAPGTNRPAIASFHGVKIQGGTVALGNFTRLMARDGRIVAAGAGNIVAAGAGNLIGNDAGSLIGNDGGSLIGNDGGSLIGNDGGSLVGPDGGSLIGMDGGSLIGMDGGSLISDDGSTLIGQDGGSLIGLDGGSLIGLDGGSLISDDGSALIGLDGGSFRAATKAASGSNSIARRAAAATGGIPSITIESGVVSGNINLVGHVLNSAGFVVPGHSAGRVRVFGDFAQESNATLLLEMGGTQTNPLQFDQLLVRGTATLGGNLIVKTIDGFSPQSGDAISPLTYNSVVGNFSSISSNAQVAFNSTGMTLQVNGPNPPAPKALNIATRMRVETGDNVLIAGFIITGNQPKRVLVRGIGPSLPVAGALADPTLDLDAGTFFNDDWRSDQQDEIEGTTIPPSSNLESAIVATLEPGAHTAVLRGKNDGTGVGLVEVYDLESGTPVQLANISTRGQVQTGDDVMIGGFIIGGDYPAKVLLRAIGPSLPIDGALQDPTLELVDSNGASITNDSWRATQEAEIIATTVPPTNDSEAAIVATLVPGAYTAVVRGKDETPGVALVEGYTLE